MNTARIIPAMISRINPQWQKVCKGGLTPVTTKTGKYAASTSALIQEEQHDSELRPVPAGPKYTVQAMIHQAEFQELLICEAEASLASQTVRSYLGWYSHWRHCGVRVNDLLDMTWVWRQRAREGKG